MIQKVGAFRCCRRHNAIEVNENNQNFDSRNNCNAIIVKSDNSLLLGCKNTIIPSGVQSISRIAFFGCSFTRMDIPNTVTSIDDYAFENCSTLSEIVISSLDKGITSIF